MEVIIDWVRYVPETKKQEMSGQFIELNWINRAIENMKWGTGREINWKRYYTREQAKETAKEQGLTIPTKQEFLDSWFTKNWSTDNKELADKLWFTLDGWCDSDGKLFDTDEYGYVWSSSEYNSNTARYFWFNGSRGILDWNDRNCAFAVRPVLK